MHIDILSVTIRGGLTAIRGPVEIAIAAVRDYIENHPFSMLYISGNHSRVLDHLKGDFDVKKVFTVYQIFGILEDVSHSVVFIEHDPLIYEGIKETRENIREDLVKTLSFVMRDAAKGRLIIYFSTTQDVFFDVIARNSDRVLFFEREPGGYFIADLFGESCGGNGNIRGCRRLHHRFLPMGQTTLQAF